MADQTQLQKIFTGEGFSDYRWIDPAEIVVAQWVRMKCQFGCDSYGRNASCPPNTPSVADCRTFFQEYRLGTVFHFAKNFAEPEERHDWSRDVNRSLIELERRVFIAGYPRAFLLFMDNCKLCRECANTRASCRNKKLARPSPEGMGVDVFSTVAKYGYPLEVLDDYDREMNRYAFLLIE
jgi:predicted metal-binding protein